MIRYTALTEDEIEEVIDRMVDARFDGLTSDERARVDREEMRSNLRPLAGKTGNVRKLGKLINEVISLALVRTLLDDDVATAATRQRVSDA